MNVYELLGIVSGMGAVGGLVNCALEGEFSLPHTDSNLKVWRPGWLGNVLCGAVAAAVVWGLYGPLSGLEVTGILEARLTFSQAFTSLVVGLSGGRILLAETQKLMLRREREAEIDAKNALATTAKKLKLSNDRKNHECRTIGRDRSAARRDPGRRFVQIQASGRARSRLGGAS